MNITIQNKPGMKEILLKNNFFQIPIKGQYEVFRLKGECSIVFYTTGKVLFQGPDFSVLHALSLIKEKPNISPKEFKPFFEEKKEVLHKEITGSDETLKGDTFGGLIVAGFKGNKEIKSKLMTLGVRDSKMLSEVQIIKIAEFLLEKYPERIHIIELKPKEYNEKTEILSVTNILNYAHKEIGLKLGGYHIVDQYPGCNVGDFRVTKAESKYIEVAAASIIARYYAIKQFNYLSKKIGFRIPKGSTHVKEALQKLKELNLDPSEFVKLHFSNVNKVFHK